MGNDPDAKKEGNGDGNEEGETGFTEEDTENTEVLIGEGRDGRRR